MEESLPMTEDIETYSPEIEKQVPLPVKNATTGFEEVQEKDGLIKTKLNKEVIIQRIARDLYKNATSGLRELYNNSARACRVAVKKYGEEKPLIRISMNEKQRRLIISDNGLGLSKERFKKVLLELGTSDNLEAGEVGQFGMGFASYMTLSSAIVIDTRARNGDQYQMLAKDGSSFQPIGDAQLEGYGTKISMTCYDNVNFTELVDKLVKVAKYSGVATTLDLEGFEYYPRGLNRGINKLEQTTFEGDIRTTKTVKEDLIEIDTEDYHLIALVGVHNPQRNHDHTHLLNVPIDSEISMPFGWWVLNIKDERKFMPQPDRDRMSEIADRKLEGIIDAAIKKYFSDLQIHSYQEFLKSDRRNEFLWLVEHQDYAELKMRAVLENINECKVRKVVYDTKYFDDGGLVYKLGLNNNIIYQGYKNRGVTDKVREFEANSLLITTKKTKKNHWKEHVLFMESFGIPTARQILIDHKVKLPKQAKADIELIGHTNFPERFYEHEMVDLEDIDENFIRVNDLPMVKVIRYVKEFPSPYTFVRNAPELDEYETRDFSEWLEKDVPNVVVPTNLGAMTIKDLSENCKEIIFCVDFKEEFEAFFKDEERIIVYGSNGLMALELYLNPECPDKIAVEIKHWDFSKFVQEKFSVPLNDDLAEKFLSSNLSKVSPCFHKLLATLLKNTKWDLKAKEMVWQGFVDRILKLNEFDNNDEIASLKFYHGESGEKGTESIWGQTFEELMNDFKHQIYNDGNLQTRLIRELIVPKIFGQVKFKSIEKQEESYQTAYEISLTTRDVGFEFKEDMEVFGFNVMFRSLKLRINKNCNSVSYSSITVKVYINT